jgi:hypothetical protein
MSKERSVAVLAAVATVAVASVSSSPVGATTAASIGGCSPSTVTRTLAGTPANYLSLVSSLQAGDRLVLAAGSYTGGLRLSGKNGVAGRCMQIEGPSSGSPAVFLARAGANTASILDSSYLVIKNLTFDGQNLAVDAVKAEATSSWAHHVTLENLVIRNHGASEQTVGISTKCPAWNWVIRRNTITRAGVGLYLGKPDGTAEFVNGLIEHNAVLDPILYGMQIKHQLGRNTGLGIPAAAKTVIRHNVWSKAANGATGTAARPNVLVGHWPLSGPGADDVYLVYGNFFWQNPWESLFQGEGNIAFYSNLLVNDGGRAIAIQRHNDVPRRIDVFRNTVIARDEGIGIRYGSTAHAQRVIGNAVFAGSPISGGQQIDNVTDGYDRAWLYLLNPDGVLGAATGALDLYPRVAMLFRTAHTTAGLTGYEDWSLDFDGRAHDGTQRGAYGGEGVNPGWKLDLAVKPEGTSGGAKGPLLADGLESGSLGAWTSAW